MKRISIAISIIALALALTSCNKNCSCEVSKEGQRIEAYDFEDISSAECDAKVDEVFDELLQNNAAESLVGVQVECSHL